MPSLSFIILVPNLALLSTLAYSLPATTPNLSLILPRDGKNTGCPDANTDVPTDAGVSHWNGQVNGCPIHNALDADGGCSSSLNLGTGSICASYCEVRTSWQYGPEIPFPSGGYCGQNDPCTATNTFSVALSETYTFNAGFSLSTKKRDVEAGGEIFQLAKRDDAEAAVKASFDIGASYSWTTTQTTAQGANQQRGSNATLLEWCGYWTNIPKTWTSCGSLTTTPISDPVVIAPCFESACATHPEPTCDTSKAKTTGNYCNTYPYIDPNTGKQAYETVFVYVGCNEQGYQPAEYQPAPFTYPGVASKFAGQFSDHVLK